MRRGFWRATRKVKALGGRCLRRASRGETQWQRWLIHLIQARWPCVMADQHDPSNQAADSCGRSVSFVFEDSSDCGSVEFESGVGVFVDFDDDGVVIADFGDGSDDAANGSDFGTFLER